jgi:hypothetical protein
LYSLFFFHLKGTCIAHEHCTHRRQRSEIMECPRRLR